ncbi:MAG: RDD family protein [Mycobacterium sp.]|nr:RDD family protein [Mycobacterium sp.]
MTIGDQDPNAYGQPSGYPPPPPPGYAPAPGYQVPGYPPQPSAGYPPPPTPGYPPVAGYQPGYPQIGYGYASHPGGLMERWGARIIDGLLVGVLSWLLAFLVGSSSSILVTGLFTGVLMFGYFVAMEATQGYTLGKKLLGLSVRGAGGAAKPDFKQSAIRNAWTLLPVIPYVGGLLGIIAIIVIAVTISSSPTKQGKHDELAGGTQVVKN